MANAINVIHPYRWDGMWVFDDDRVGLVREPFVEGADGVIDEAVMRKGLRDPESGFRLFFSSEPFPRYDLKLQWLREEAAGNWYRAEDLGMEGWLCPALLRYFDSAPKTIYARFEEKE